MTREVYLGMRPDDLEDKPYARYWSPDMRGLSETVSQALLQSPFPASYGFAPRDCHALLEREVRPYSHMPLWMPARDNRVGFNRFDLTRSLEAGLTYRPLAVTARDTLDYHTSRPIERQQHMRAGISAKRERELLDAWHAAAQ